MDIKKIKISNWALTHIKKNEIYVPKNVSDVKKFILYAKKKNI